MKERVLEMSLAECIDFFQVVKYKLFDIEMDEEGESSGTIRVEVPRYEEESFIIELCFLNEEQRKRMEARLRESGFIKQTIRFRRTF